MTEAYEAVRYAADGHGGETDPHDPTMSDGAILARGTLQECRQAIARRLDSLTLDEARWPGTGDDIEAYHENDDEGCGGWAIRRAE